MVNNMIANLTYEYETIYNAWLNSSSRNKQAFCSLYKLIFDGLVEARSIQHLWVEIAITQQYYKDKEQLNALFQSCIRE